MKVTIDASDLRRAVADLRNIGKQAAFAQVVALTRTAVALKAVEQDEIRRVFDRPTPFTQNSLYVSAATKSFPEARLGLKDGTGAAGRQVPPAKYLAAEIDAGSRHRKAFERALQRNGAMPDGWFLVPGRDAQLDAYGNLSRRSIQQILSQLSIHDTQGRVRPLRSGSDAKSKALRARAFSRAGGQYFALPARHGRLKPGIYQRERRGPLRVIALFVRHVSYRRRFDFHGVAEQAYPEIFAAKLDEALDQYAGR